MSSLPEREVSVFNAARQLPATERAAYLDVECGEDAPLRQRIEELLRTGVDLGDFLEQPAHAELGGDVVAGGIIPQFVAPVEKTGDRIGPYKLLQQIGEGGCGVVYMAEQEAPIRRRVALKVIKPGMDSRQVIFRFEAERHALALMDHPNIAKVLDAGRTETGRPYFVMELVKGIRITEFCDQDSLTTRQRLDLFIQVCQAIQHAHQKGIIHRDIKPTNILVTVIDGVPVPKVIDFGIAKATQGRLSDETMFTAFGQFLGTPTYMSPEQAVLSGVDVDTRSDIYSLGVLLYELLTSQTPFDAKALLKAGLEEMRRTIREQEPARPSTKLSTMEAAALTTASKLRRSEPPKLIHQVQGDLDWIVMKCLEKDRNRRYETATELLRDVERHLNDEAIVARPPSRLYRFQKLARRNKGAFAAIGAVAAALVIGMVATSMEAIRASRAENEQRKLRTRAQADETKAKDQEAKAKTEASKSQQVAQFMMDILDGASPIKAMGRDTTVLREILNDTEKRLAAELKDQPAVQAELREDIGSVYYHWSEYAKAEELCRQALSLAETAFGQEGAETLDYRNHLAQVLEFHGKLVEAEGLNKEALDLATKFYGPTSVGVATVLEGMARNALLRMDLPQAGNWSRRSLALDRKLVEQSRGTNLDAELALDVSLDVLGTVLLDEWQTNEAESLHRESLTLMTNRLDQRDYRVARAINNLAVTLRQEGKLGEAEELHRKALAMAENAFGPSDSRTTYCRNGLGIVLRRRAAATSDLATLQESLRVAPSEALTADALAAALAQPSLTPLAPEALGWRFTATDPPTNWTAPDFPDGSWSLAAAVAGSTTYIPRTDRNPPPSLSLTNLWLRREFTLPEVSPGILVFRINRNHDAQIFLNGVQAAPIADWRDSDALVPAWPRGREALKQGRNTLAVFCRDADGGGPIDVRLYMTQDRSLGQNGVIEKLSRMIQEGPVWSVLFIGRAQAFARQARWSDAAADMAKVVELEPTEANAPARLGPLLIKVGDLAGYDRVRRAALQRFASPDSPDTGAQIAKLALLAPLDGDALKESARLADDAALADYPDVNLSSRQFAKGLAEFRQGRFYESANWTDKAFLSNQQPILPGWSHARQRNRQVMVLLVQAMSRQKMGRTDEARSQYQKAIEIMRTQFPTAESGDIGVEWLDWLTAQTLQREAAELFGGTPE
jgi:serine/threonine protein kinase